MNSLRKYSCSLPAWICLIVALVWGCDKATGAERARFQFEVDYHFLVGLGDGGNREILSHIDPGRNGEEIMFRLLYNINRKFTAGLGIGTSLYHNRCGTFPLVGSFRYRPFSGKHLTPLYAFTDIGASLYDSNEYYGGALWNIGIGWNKMFRKHFGIDVQLGYQLRHFNYRANVWDPAGPLPYTVKNGNILHNSLSLGFGLMF